MFEGKCKFFAAVFCSGTQSGGVKKVDYDPGELKDIAIANGDVIVGSENNEGD